MPYKENDTVKIYDPSAFVPPGKMTKLPPAPEGMRWEYARAGSNLFSADKGKGSVWKWYVLQRRATSNHTRTALIAGGILALVGAAWWLSSGTRS